MYNADFVGNTKFVSKMELLLTSHWRYVSFLMTIFPDSGLAEDSRLSLGSCLPSSPDLTTLQFVYGYSSRIKYTEHQRLTSMIWSSESALLLIMSLLICWEILYLGRGGQQTRHLPCYKWYDVEIYWICNSLDIWKGLWITLITLPARLNGPANQRWVWSSKHFGGCVWAM